MVEIILTAECHQKNNEINVKINPDFVTGYMDNLLDILPPFDNGLRCLLSISVSKRNLDLMISCIGV